MPKATWKKRGVDDDAIRQALRAQKGNVTRAAAALGVDRRTLGRWLKGDSSLAPRQSGKPRGRARPGARAGRVLDLNPAAWAEQVRKDYVLSPTEEQLLDLAVRALQIARDDAQKPGDRLAGSIRFCAIVKQLNLPELEGDGEAEKTPGRPRRIK